MPRQVKKVFHFISSVFLYSVMAVLILIFFMFAAYFVDQRVGLRKGETRAPLFGAYIIISNSMVPNINVYDAVVTVRVDQKNIKVDDIITFISKEIETQGTPITHRVVGIVYENNDKKSGKVMGYRTKGDHNNTPDFAIIAPNEVLGKVYLRIPMIGYLQAILTKRLGWFLIIVVPCLLLIGNDFIKIILAVNKKNAATDDDVVVIIDEDVKEKKTKSKKKKEEK